MATHPRWLPRTEEQEATSQNDPEQESEVHPELDWTAAQAIKTYQFYALVALSVAYGIPWGVISVYGRLHLETLGFATAMAGSILGVRVLMSLFGRLTGVFGDFIAPQRLLALVLLIEGLGSVGLVVATTPALAYASVVLIGLGFGAAYVSVPVTYSAFYGRRAFGATVGARFALTGLISPAAPTLAGLLSDLTGSYSPAFLAMGAICAVGALLSFWMPSPGQSSARAGLGHGLVQPTMETPAQRLLRANELDDEATSVLEEIGFEDSASARRLLFQLAEDESQAEALLGVPADPAPGAAGVGDAGSKPAQLPALRAWSRGSGRGFSRLCRQSALDRDSRPALRRQPVPH